MFVGRESRDTKKKEMATNDMVTKKLQEQIK